MMEHLFVRDLWLKHAYDGFPREVGYKRLLVWSEEEFVQAIGQLFEEHTTTTVNIGLFPGHYSKLWSNKVFIDLDGQGVWSEMRRIYSWLKLEYNYEPRIYFSGKKGFHLYIDFMPLVVKEPREILRGFGEWLKERLKLETLDLQVFEPRRMGRVPYTLHPDSGRYCIPVRPWQSVEEIIKESIKPRLKEIRINIINDRFRELLLSFDKEQRKRSKTLKSPTLKGYEWIEKLLSTAVPNGRRRLALYIISPYLARKYGELEPALGQALTWLQTCKRLRHTTLSRSELRNYVQRALSLGVIKFYSTPERVKEEDPQLYEIIREVD